MEEEGASGTLNLTTHVMFAIAVGAVFFGRPEIILLLGVGAAIPDLDREYAFLSEDSFRKHQVHRAVCHNFLFLGLVFLVNPFLGLGAFLHTLLDALTTAKDRGVEWLYPFTRFIRRALYDSQGKPLKFDPSTKVYLYQNDPIELTRKSAEDLKEYTPGPWRRTYGPALSGGALDTAIFAGSIAIVILLAVLSKLGLAGEPLYLHSLFTFDYNFHVPLIIGIIGIALELGAGELDRRSIAKNGGNYKIPARVFRVAFFLAVAIMVFALVLGAYLNPALVASFAAQLPYLALGALIVFLVAAITLMLYSSKHVSSYLRWRLRRGWSRSQEEQAARERKEGKGEKDDPAKDDIAII